MKPAPSKLRDTPHSGCGYGGYQRRSGAAPFLKENTVVAAVTKNLPVIVADLKAGVFRERYADAPGWLVFHQEKNELSVMEINDFGKDFLALCDGSHSMEKIAGCSTAGTRTAYPLRRSLRFAGQR